MPIDKQFWTDYISELDRRISDMVILRDKIKALLEVEGLLEPSAIETAVSSLKDLVELSASRVSDIPQEVATKLGLPENQK